MIVREEKEVAEAQWKVDRACEKAEETEERNQLDRIKQPKEKKRY